MVESRCMTCTISFNIHFTAEAIWPAFVREDGKTNSKSRSLQRRYLRRRLGSSVQVATMATCGYGSFSFARKAVYRSDLLVPHGLPQRANQGLSSSRTAGGR